MEAPPAPTFRAGFVALIGRPNAGKSTLMNALLKFDLSIVSPKPQTTRHSILGILNGPGHQICFVDTPGLLDQSRDLLQDALMRTTRRVAREDADVRLLLVEPYVVPAAETERLAAILGKSGTLILAINKADLVSPRTKLDAVRAAYAALSPARSVVLSARSGEGVADLREAILALMPVSPPYYETDRLSDRWERFFVAEIIRAGLFEAYREEIPHACAVEIEEFKENPGKKDLIRAWIYVERSNQKGILLGPRGAALRELAKNRTLAIEKFLGRRVELDLWVKVRAGWRKDLRSLKEFGYAG